MITFIDFFAGIGGFRSGFEKAGMKCVGFCEFDKFARQSYEAIYDTKGEWRAYDIREVCGTELPRADVWTFGFPCQDISIAGEKRGLHDGTRSGLFFEIMRLVKEAKEYKPKWLVAENVKHLLSIDGGRGFLKLLTEMDKAGYDTEWRVYNSKDYGVPQNRERVYIVGHLRGRGGQLLLPTPRQGGTSICQLGNLFKTDSFGGNPMRGRVYASDGIAPTLTTSQGGGTVPKIQIVGRCSTHGTEGIYADTGHVGALMARDYKGAKLVSCSPSHTIRKLTPLEYWRLQGFTDEQFAKAKAMGVSNSQLYKQAGNAVTVPVTYEIGAAIVKVAIEEEQGV